MGIFPYYIVRKLKVDANKTEENLHNKSSGTLVINIIKYKTSKNPLLQQNNEINNNKIRNKTIDLITTILWDKRA